MLTQLRMYHDLGFPLVFLRPKTKMPVEKNWSKHGFDPNQLAKYEPGQNVGIKLGHRLPDGNYLGAIDVDIIDDKHAHEAWAMLKSFAPTYAEWPKVTSGRGNGSGHFYFLSPHPITSKTLGSNAVGNVKVWEISLMGIGRQCVAPPSIHPSGATYTWETDLCFLSVESLQTASTVVDDLTNLEITPEMRNQIRLARVKDRSTTLFRCTLTMLKIKVPEEKIIEILTDRKYLLAHVPFEHTGSSDLDKARAWFTKYVLEPAKDRLQAGDLIRDKHGNISPAYANAKILTAEVFNHEPFLKHNLFRNAFEWSQPVPWAGSTSERSAGREDALLLGDYLLEKYGVKFYPATLDELLTTEAMKHSYHPVRDYLDSLTWDGIPRIGRMFQTYHGSTMKADYLEEAAQLWMTAAVARIYEPGIKFDYALVLEGRQGVGKSTFLEILASKPWFLDSLPDLADKDAAVNIQGAWICEIAELAAMNRSTIDSVKAYLSRNVDRVRPPYGQRRVDVPRSTVFAGTTNLKFYLHDPTGARRFWPILVGRCDFKALKRDRDQLWAEAAFNYHFNPRQLYPSFTMDNYLAYLQSDRRVDDEGDEARALLTSWVAAQASVPPMTLAELFTQGPLLSMRRTRTADLRVAAILEDLGFVVQKINGLKYWLYRGHVDD